MGWRKLGWIFAPDGSVEWMASHAQVPTVLVRDDRLRVYFASRDANGRALTACLDVDREDPTRVVKVYDRPVLGFGKPGTFDEDGVMPGDCLEDGDRILMYYSGWNQKVSTPYHNATGLAVSTDGGLTFERCFEGPVMERSPTEPYLAVTPSVLKIGPRYRCWYISGLRWVSISGKYEPVYVVKRAESEDGVTWVRPPEICIPQRHELEAFSHPCVRFIGGRYRMWYCYRDSVDYRDGNGSYRLGYAESLDGIAWSRLDELVGIEPSASGWDSTMLAYPYVVEVDGRRLLFYNGNGFGRSGFGVAILD